MPNKTKSIVYTILIVVSLFFRLLFIGDIPYGLSWDETAYVYNAYSILKTGRDEWGAQNPMYLRSFGEYKPAALSYMFTPVFVLLREANIAVRLVPAILGVVSILGLYEFMRKITHDNHISFLTSVIVATSPWHIHFSRAAFDPIVSFAFLMIGFYLFTKKRVVSQILSSLLLGLSMYTYNSSRFFVPAILLAYFVILHKKKIKEKIRESWLSITLIGLIGAVILWQTIFGVAGIHAKFLLIANEPYIAVKSNNLFDGCQKAQLPFCQIIANRRFVIAGEITKQYLSHFQSDFLFFDKNSPTTSFPNYGNLLITTLPFLIIGLFTMRRYNKKINTFFIAWLLLSPIPASLTNEAPHAGRTLIGLPAFAYFISLGLITTVSFFKKRRDKKITAIIITITFLINISFYIKDYGLIYKQDSEYVWQGYFKEVIPYVWKQKDKYKSVYFSDAYTNPFIFFAWYNKIDPNLVQKYKGRNLISNIQFVPQEKVLQAAENKNMKSLIVSSTKIDNLQPLKQFSSLSIYKPSQIWFYVYEKY